MGVKSITKKVKKVKKVDELQEAIDREVRRLRG